MLTSLYQPKDFCLGPVSIGIKKSDNIRVPIVVFRDYVCQKMTIILNFNFESVDQSFVLFWKIVWC